MAEASPQRIDDPFLRTRTRTDFTPAEQTFSVVLQERIQQLLSGERDTLSILRRYPGDPERLGVLSMPADVPREQLRLSVVESLSLEALRFLCPDQRDGPVAQQPGPDGSVIERQLISTKFPHIVVMRTDRFVGDSAEPAETTWTLERVQNQRRQTQVNRLLDAANLALELVKIVR